MHWYETNPVGLADPCYNNWPVFNERGTFVYDSLTAKQIQDRMNGDVPVFHVAWSESVKLHFEAYVDPKAIEKFQRPKWLAEALAKWDAQVAKSKTSVSEQRQFWRDGGNLNVSVVRKGERLTHQRQIIHDLTSS